MSTQAREKKPEVQHAANPAMVPQPAQPFPPGQATGQAQTSPAVIPPAPRALAPVPAGADEGSGILPGDILIPRILLMQPTSDWVAEKRARAGDIIRSTPFEIIGDEKKPLQFIPMKAQNLWMYQEFIPGKKRPEFRGFTPRDGGLNDPNLPENQKTGAALPWDFVWNNNKWKRVQVFNVLALLPADILAYGAEVDRANKAGDIMDPDKMLMPVSIGFQNTSFKAGKEVATFMEKAHQMRSVPYVGVFELGVSAESNDQGNYFIWTAKRAEGAAGKTQREWLALAQQWTATLRSQKVQLDDSALEKMGGEVVVQSTPANPNQF